MDNKADRVMVFAVATDSGLRVTDSYFFVGRRVMDRKKWMEVR